MCRGILMERETLLELLHNGTRLISRGSSHPSHSSAWSTLEYYRTQHIVAVASTCRVYSM